MIRWRVAALVGRMVSGLSERTGKRPAVWLN